MMIGVISFSFAIGSLSSVVQNLDSKQAKLKVTSHPIANTFQEKLSTLNEIKATHKLNYDLYSRLRFCLKYDHSKDASDQLDFLEELPFNLRAELSLVMHKNLID